MPQMKLADIILDWTLYPRQKVDRTHVGHIADAIRSGTTMPPVMVDKKSRRLVDGFHRWHAQRRVHGEDAKIAVQLHEYADDAAIYYAAGEFNATHGRAMTPFDRLHYISRAQELGIDPARIATVLNTTVERIQELTISRTAIIGGDSKVEGPGRRVPLKRTIRRLAGSTLTPRQEQANDRLSGMQASFYVNQVIELLEAELVDWDDADMLERLRRLEGLLTAALAAQPTAAATA
jgi:hypothetical protein